MQTQGSSDAIPSLSPCAKLSSVLHMTAVKCRMKTGAGTSSAAPLGCGNEMSQ